MEQQNGAGGVATAAKEQAGQVGQTAAQAGGQVAQTTKEQAANVVGEAKNQVRDLVGEARTQVSGQAGQQKGRAVEGIRSLASELDDMTQRGGQSGIATDVARQVASRAHGLADHLDRHEPAELLDQVRAYARRRPVAFLAGAAVLGVLAGRLTRNLASSDDGSGPSVTSTPQLDSGSGYRSGSGYGSAAYQDYAAIEAVPAYPVTDPAVTVGYEPDYSGGFRQGDAGYDPARPYESATDATFQAAPTYEPGFDAPAPGSTHQPEGTAQDREWRNA